MCYQNNPCQLQIYFSSTLEKQRNKTDAVNHEVLEDLKDGDQFAAKYKNEKPDTNQLAVDRWKLLYITDDNLEEKQVIMNGDTTCTTQKICKISKMKFA